MMLIEPAALRACSGCRHWNVDVKVAADGYLKGICEQSSVPDDHEWRRGGDRCGHWERRAS